MAKQVKKRTWGFLRETAAKAKGIDRDTGVSRTGLEQYLKVIFPEVDDWVHDKTGPFFTATGEKSLLRPDYRSDTLKLVVEFDGLQHYTSPENVLRDAERNTLYERNGYKVVRIPFFIQLSNKAVETLFGVSVAEPLFDETIPSMGIKGKNTPAYMCAVGLHRMAEEFHRFPEQFQTNVAFLESQNSPVLTGVDLLKREYESLGGDR